MRLDWERRSWRRGAASSSSFCDVTSIPVSVNQSLPVVKWWLQKKKWLSAVVGLARKVPYLPGTLPSTHLSLPWVSPWGFQIQASLLFKIHPKVTSRPGELMGEAGRRLDHWSYCCPVPSLQSLQDAEGWCTQGLSSRRHHWVHSNSG